MDANKPAAFINFINDNLQIDGESEEGNDYIEDWDAIADEYEADLDAALSVLHNKLSGDEEGTEAFSIIMDSIVDSFHVIRELVIERDWESLDDLVGTWEDIDNMEDDDVDNE